MPENSPESDFISSPSPSRLSAENTRELGRLEHPFDDEMSLKLYFLHKNCVCAFSEAEKDVRSGHGLCVVYAAPRTGK
jgi:hypothetical protein